MRTTATLDDDLHKAALCQLAGNDELAAWQRFQTPAAPNQASAAEFLIGGEELDSRAIGCYSM